MANIKITELPKATTIGENDLIPVVTGIGGTPVTEHITKYDFAATISSSPTENNPVENTYSDIAAMLADQGSQTTNYFNYVVDASADPNVVSGEAYYEKLTISTTTLSTDYRLLSDTEVTIVADSNSYRVFRIQDIQDEATPLTSVSGGKVSFEYNGANVTAILFNKLYTDAIEEFYGKDVSIRFHNRTTKRYETEAVASTAWTTVNTDYYRAEVTGTNIQIADLSANNRVEFFIVETSAAGGGGNAAAATGTVIDLSNNICTYYNMSSASSSTTYTTTGSVLGGRARLLVNSLTEPSISGATKINGDPFLPLQDTYIEVEYNGVRVEYWFKSIYISPEQDIIGLPFGKLIDKSSSPSTDFYGTPSILKTSLGRIIASHDIFGSTAVNEGDCVLWFSDDNGINYDKRHVFTSTFWANIFEQGGVIYMIYSTNFVGSGDYTQADIYLRWSNDNGDSWETPIELFADDGTFNGYLTHATNVIERDGYIALGVSRRDSTGLGFASPFNVTILYGDTTDLTDSTNWTLGTWVTFAGGSLPSTIWTNTTETNRPKGSSLTKGHLESCLVYDGTNTYLHCRLEQTPNSNYGLYYNVTWNSGTPTTSTISTTPNYHEFMGGHLKTQISWDSTSSKFWTIANYNRTKWMNDGRFELYLCNSSNLSDWTPIVKVGGYTLSSDWENQITDLATQYASFIIDGNDILYVARSTTPDASTAHNADALTISKIENFRSITADTYVDGALILDENSTRLEDINGIGYILDQTIYQNGAFMLTADNASKVSWTTGFNFTGSEYMRILYNEHLTLDNSTGFTIYAVIENLQDTGGKRILSFGDTGVDDTQAGNWFFSMNVGLGVETARGVYTDLTTTNDYIIASSFDATNDHIYNFLNGANRGDPPTKNAVTWDTDHLVMTTGYTGSYLSELRFGNRIVGSTQPFSSLIKAIHIIPSYTTPANVITYMGALNSTYSIY